MSLIKRKTDCELIADNFENIFSDLGDCFDTTFDEKKSKTDVAGSVFSLGKSITKLAWGLGSCAVITPPVKYTKRQRFYFVLNQGKVS